MNDATTSIDDLGLREQIKVRYEAGERATLCAEFGVGLRTLSRWALTHGWTSGKAADLTRHQQAYILIEEGYNNATIARLLSMATDTVRGLRHKLTTNQVARPVGGIRAEHVPRERPAGHWGGWYCGSCAWWGDTIDAYLMHKKHHERQQ